MAEPSGLVLADVLPSTLAALGVPGWPDRIGLGERLGRADRVAVLLVDGLGHRLLPRARSVAPALADVVDGRLGTLLELWSGFPSTTPTSVVSIGTGVASGAHGVLGFTLNVPGTDTVLNHVEWRDDPDPRSWQPVPTVFSRAAAAGVAVTVVSRPEYQGSGLTVAAYRGAAYVPATGPDELGERMLAGLRAGPGLVYGYHPSVDAAAHAQLAAVARTDRLVTTLLDGLPAGAALLVTADHGGFDAPDDQRIDLDADPRLAAGVRVVAGEPRVRYLHTVPGAQADVLAAWRSVLGPVADVASRDEAIAAGWFGPVPGAHRARIGDVVVVCRDRHVILATRHEKPSTSALVGFHGGLTADETAVPLVVFPAA